MIFEKYVIFSNYGVGVVRELYSNASHYIMQRFDVSITNRFVCTISTTMYSIKKSRVYVQVIFIICKKKFPRYIKLTYQLLFKAMFPKIILEFGRQAVNSRQGKSAAKAGTLNNIS